MCSSAFLTTCCCLARDASLRGTCVAAPTSYARAEVYSDDANQKEKEEEKDGARRVPRSKTVLDDANAVLAMGARRRRHEDRRAAADGALSKRA